MKTTFIATVFNEEKTIEEFLSSILKQSAFPDEVIIVDGGSTDATASVISNLKSQISNKRIRFKFIVKKGNRAVGRNEAIKQAKNEIIVCSDAGCILDKDWVRNITEPFNDPKIGVVSGYYKGKARNIFEKCLLPYILVMSDKVDGKYFLPASRSMAFREPVWKRAGGFPEEYSHNEDYVFAQRLKKIRANIVFEKTAVVDWLPRKNIIQAFTMFFRFALGDSEAGILRLKVLFIFIRYFLGTYLLLLSFIEKSYLLLKGIILAIVLYLIWSVLKNYKYVKNYKAVFFLPILQLVSDAAILLGTSIGFFKRFSIKTLFKITANNKAVSLLIFLYIAVMIYLIRWGAPNPNHPFPYHMDEWHQLQAVRAVFNHGTPNIEGAAHGPLFHFLLSGILLGPFALTGFVNPFSIQSAVTQLDLQEKLFIVLRLETLFFGTMAVIILAKIIKENFRTQPFLGMFFFIVSPIWLSLSNYFKYDIALTFWIILSIFFLLRYIRQRSIGYFALSGLIIGTSLATKFTAFPLVLIYVVSFFLFPLKHKKKIAAITGTIILLGTFTLMGIPDAVFFHRGDYIEFIYSNLVVFPKGGTNFILGMDVVPYLLFRGFPFTFGHTPYLLLAGSLIYWIYKIFNAFTEKAVYKYKAEFFIILSFLIFALSLVPLGLTATGNRALVLLPFLAIITAFTYKNLVKSLSKYWKSFFYLVIFIFMIIQIVESYAWVAIKTSRSPQETASNWIMQNIREGTEIGIENIPIYQSLPDIIVKEFYNKQYNIAGKQKYKYKVINERSKILPNIIIISNPDSINYQKKPSKKELIKRLQKEKYGKITTFSLNFTVIRLFGSKVDYFINSMAASPSEISIYEK